MAARRCAGTGYRRSSGRPWIATWHPLLLKFRIRSCQTLSRLPTSHSTDHQDGPGLWRVSRSPMSHPVAVHQDDPDPLNKNIIMPDNSFVGMEIDTVYQGSMTTGFGSIAKFETGLDLYKRISGVWFKVGGCYDTLEADDDLTDNQTLSCTASNAGTNTYRAGATHKAHTQNWHIWTTTIVDFYDSGDGNHDKAETDRLELCHGAC